MDALLGCSRHVTQYSLRAMLRDKIQRYSRPLVYIISYYIAFILLHAKNGGSNDRELKWSHFSYLYTYYKILCVHVLLINF